MKSNKLIASLEIFFFHF